MKRLISIVFAIILAVTPAVAKGYPDRQIVDDILTFYADTLHLTKHAPPKIVVVDFCDLQNEVTKSRNACLVQAVQFLFFGTTYYAGYYTPDNDGTIKLTDNYDWDHLTRTNVRILAHELAHHAFMSNGFFGISERDTDILAKKFVAWYFSKKSNPDR